MSFGANTPVRRAQLIAPFGPGAMIVVRGGTSLVAAGLDHWFEREDRAGAVDWQEFQISEWRLQGLLGVDHFRVPPDYRIARPGDNTPNCFLTVPFLRFPQWHFCPSCHLLQELPLSRRGRVACPECAARKRTRYMYQVPFVAMCDHGHIQDFPWREWVHKSTKPSCQRPLRLVATGSASLSGQKVECGCGASRTLSQVTQAYPSGGTFLSDHLADDGIPFLCQGHRPWLGNGSEEPCSRPLRGTLRSASNVYYAQVRSAIYLPRGADPVQQELVGLMEDLPLSTLISLLTQLHASPDAVLAGFRQHQPLLLQPYSDEQILAALAIVTGEDSAGAERDAPVAEGEQQIPFRKAEFDVLRTPRDEPQLRIRACALSDYDRDVASYFSRVMLVDKLRETRVLAGFTRIFPENEQPLQELERMLWREPPPAQQSWLPAYVVYGEGIYLELDDARLREWERRADVRGRVERLARRYGELRTARRLEDRSITPRLVLLHTLAHLIINRLTFECGYSSAALRERLYVSQDPGFEMAGLLIYTAAGDAEGTMGGLVRMGKPGYLEPVIRRALESAEWCSADPVCMEMGDRGGQGPDSCNLAACHSCALVPETACEEFNRFLDRAVVVGDFANRQLGYFTS